MSRTPWGGNRIARDMKSALGIPLRAIGESWELSVEPDFPSRLDNGTLLQNWLALHPEALGDEAGLGSTALLVKLLDADEPLSVQIHPADDDAALADDESGKPESWYVVAREEGAGIYLGLMPGVDAARMQASIDSGEDVSKLLRFVPVEVGDFFVIEAGTPHAIGEGLLLVEPQRVRPGRRGLTYRYWDWDRKYDANGTPAADGQARPLHLDRALAVTRWSDCVGDAWLDRIRFRAGAPQRTQAARLTDLTSYASSDALVVSRLEGSGALELEAVPTLAALTVLEGELAFADQVARKGETWLVPANTAVSLHLQSVHAIVSRIRAR